MEQVKCKGCGAILQNTDPQEIGYTPKTDGQYCQRCFKMIHYDSHKEQDFMPNNQLVLDQLNSLSGNFIWIIDIFDFDTSLIGVIPEFYKDKSCSVVLNKCDLLPETINYEKLAKYVLKRIKALGIHTKAILTRGVNNDFREVFDEYVYDPDQPLIMSGMANVGKSTIINHLLNDQLVTTNRYPATTININEINGEKYHIFDTVGAVSSGSVQFYLTNKQLKLVVPQKRIRPVIYQLYSNQTISLGGIARIDILNSHKATVAVYVSNLLEQKRNKYENADRYWNNAYGKELSPTLKGCESFSKMKKYTFSHTGKKDYFISGLGFVTITSSKADVQVYVDERINVVCREAMI